MPSPAHGFERVPLDGVVTGGDRHAAGGPGVAHGQLQGGGRADPEVHDLTAGRLQARQYAAARHLARGSRVAADQHLAPDHVRAEGMAVVDEQVRRQALADDAAGAANCDS